MNYKTPGVYIEEITKLPPSIAAVETAIPVFIGYTEFAKRGPEDLLNKPTRIKSMFEYVRFFGGAQKEGENIRVDIASKEGQPDEVNASISQPSNYLMAYALQAFFSNGGGPCYVVSVGGYNDAGTVSDVDLKKGLDEAGKVDEITLNVFPDSVKISDVGTYYNLQAASLNQCVDLQDRFAVMDVWVDPNDEFADNIQTLRNSLPAEVNVLKYGAAYYPNLITFLDYAYDAEKVKVVIDGEEKTLAGIKDTENARYNLALNVISTQLNVVLPPSAAVVGVYAQVDNARGVWKAPANVNITDVLRPSRKITDKDQETINVDASYGKSVNAIRSFTGRGPSIIWGARTLAGNDNEWRYINVRRFFNMVEESTKKATAQFVFEPNDRNTWTRVRAMISNFLTLQWRSGALMGTTPEEAYYVKVGLNETMSELDILEGRMIVEIGMAVVRPAEFIILKFSHKMLSES